MTALLKNQKQYYVTHKDHFNSHFSSEPWSAQQVPLPSLYF